MNNLSKSLKIFKQLTLNFFIGVGLPNSLVYTFIFQEKVEGVGSSDKDELAVSDSVVTPTSKFLGKRGVDTVDSLDIIDLGDCDTSTTKETKVVRVKIEGDK